jgi:hypothetical protein
MIGFLVQIEGVWWFKIGDLTFSEMHALHACGAWVHFEQEYYKP